MHPSCSRLAVTCHQCCHAPALAHPALAHPQFTSVEWRSRKDDELQCIRRMGSRGGVPCVEAAEEEVHVDISWSNKGEGTHHLKLPACLGFPG